MPPIALGHPLRHNNEGYLIKQTRIENEIEKFSISFSILV